MATPTPKRTRSKTHIYNEVTIERQSFFKHVLSLFPITLWIERGEELLQLNSRAQRRINTKTRRFLAQRKRFLAEEEKLRERRNELMEEIGESVRYVEIFLDGHTYRILLGYNELDGDPAAVAEALGAENEWIFQKALERDFVAEVTIPFNARMSIQRTVEALQALAARKGGRVEYDQRNPIRQRVNRGMLEFYCEQRNVPFPSCAFPDRRFARVYVDPVKQRLD